MKCKAVKRKLLLYVSGDLNRRSSREVEEHLAHCPVCRQEFLTLQESMSAIREADLKERQKLPEWDEKVWAGLMKKISTGETLISGKSRSWQLAWRKLAPVAAAVAGFMLIFFLSYRLIDHFGRQAPAQQAASNDLTATGQPEEKVIANEHELNLKKEATTEAQISGSTAPEKPVQPAIPSRVEVAKSRTLPSEKSTGAQTGPVSGVGEKVGPASPAGGEQQPAAQPDRVEMAFILPESGIQVLWILDRNFNLEGVKK
ncbi:MAG: anti-sigma factor family protein [Candidatus Saccharicenans sp.]|uniref:anti-sigma factor family protein n=1 Tax=Candidatus Saccharicenans sp. TaxID=2819258 RepID=UPI00404A1C9B